MAYNGKYMHGMGWTLVVMGSLNIILGIAADAAFGSMGAYAIEHYVSAPIWNGIFVVITGILAINSGKKPTSKGLMVAVMVLGIFTIITAIGCFVIAFGGAASERYICPYYDDIYGYIRYRYGCDSASIALHVVNAVLAFTEVVMAFVAAIMPCCGLACCRLRNNPNDAPVVVYNQQGPNMTHGQAAYVIMQTGVPGTEGAPYTTVSAAGGIPQQQVFIAQHQYPSGAPMQEYYVAQALPPYMQQSTIGTAAAAGQPPAGPPAETKTQPPA
ncbi:PREDICTED: uncharacterized protein LOC109477175 [Branchiostoma belcheri]|uniref:Uncharacterized protein LOC109477175 n=1 Tax=Branchiostoma belcheri TaxID=7741 RepID=A0A6P4ZVY8_BRABE|nr:PREDICTED: uncharacterized protein LOC109477175 [Branchiostoma belcheri]